MEPQVLVFSLAVKPVIEVAKGIKRVFVEAERQHKRDLGHVHTVLLCLVPGAEQRVGAGIPGEGTVGAVKEHTVHLGVGQQFGVLAQHPGVRGAVVSEERLAPEIISSGLLCPGGMVGILHGLGILSDDFRIVLHLGTGSIVALVPCPVEHEHLLVLLSPVISSHGAAQRIRSSPMVTVYNHVLGHAKDRKRKEQCG